MRNSIVIACFFLSGVAELICEICWIRTVRLTFGSTTFAVSTTLALFFFGLAVGHYHFGKISHRTSRPLVLYAWLQLGLAGLALASVPLLELAGGVFGVAYRALEGRHVVLTLVQVVLVIPVLFPAAYLMGGALPLLCRYFVVRDATVARSVAALYGVNTLGAAVGCSAAGFVLVPFWGVRWTLAAAAALCLIAGAVVLVLRPQAVAWQEPKVARRRSVPAPAAGMRAMGAVVFCAGFTALAYEVLWSRFLALVVRGADAAYVMALSVALFGIVLGTAIAATFADRVRHLASCYAGLQVLNGLLVLGLVLLPPEVWQAVGDQLEVLALLLLPPAVLSGASLPMAVRMVVSDARLASLGVGRLAALSTLGGVAGSLAVGLVGLPLFGLMTNALLASAVSVGSGLAVWLVIDRGSVTFRASIIAVSLGLWLSLPMVLRTQVPADFLGDPRQLVDYREGRESNVAVRQVDGALVLEIDKLPQGVDRKTHQVMAAHVPMLLHHDPKRVLVVGVGTGQAARRFLMYDIERLDCVDIEPAVFDLCRAYFPSDWMDDERVHLVADDGRRPLIYGDGQYDVVSLELGQVFRPGVASFYTVDFYRAARKRLRAGGLLVQFVPITHFPRDAFDSVVGTFLAAFPQSVLWYNTSELLLIGTTADRLHVDVGRLESRMALPRVHEDLGFSYWGGQDQTLNRREVFLGGFLTGPSGLATLSANAPLLDDDRPVLERVADDRQTATQREVPIIRRIESHLEEIASITGDQLDAESRREADATRSQNIHDLFAKSYLRTVSMVRRRGDERAAVRWLAEALRANPASATAQRMMGEALAAQGDVEGAERHFLEALSINPGYAEAHCQLGTLMLTRRDPQRGREHLQRALQIRPRYAAARQQLEVAEEMLRSGAESDGPVRE